MARMTGFIFQDEYLERLAKLSDQEIGRLVRALAIYHATGEQQELAGRESVAFDFIKVDIDKIDEKYAAKCETNRRARLSANVDEQSRQSSNDNERGRTSTNDDQVIVKEKEKEIYTTTPTARARVETPFGMVEVDELQNYAQQYLTGLTAKHLQELTDYEQILGTELVMHAIDDTVANSVRSWAYTRTILQAYIKDNIKTVAQAEEKKAKRKQSAQPAGKTVTAQLYNQREYTEAELESRTADLLSEAAGVSV